jgi:hypothetical protein
MFEYDVCDTAFLALGCEASRDEEGKIISACHGRNIWGGFELGCFVT